MHSVLIVATVDRGHGDSVGRRSSVGTTKSVGCSPLCAHRRMLEGVGRRVDPRAAWNALHVEGSGATADNNLRSVAEALKGTLISGGKRLKIRYL
jgi:hypothetical protein